MMKTLLTFIAFTILSATAIQTAEGLQEFQFRGFSISPTANLIRREKGPGAGGGANAATGDGDATDASVKGADDTGHAAEEAKHPADATDQNTGHNDDHAAEHAGHTTADENIHTDADAAHNEDPAGHSTDAHPVNADANVTERKPLFTTKDDDHDVTTGCTTLRLLDGNVCEQSCFRNKEKALHDEPELKEGTCSEIGYTVVKASAWFMIFMEETSTHPMDGDWMVEPHCKMHYLVKHGVCENFCVRDDKPEMVKFAQSRDGIKEGLCYSNHYPRYVGRKNFTIFINPGIEDGSIPDPLEADHHDDHHGDHADKAAHRTEGDAHGNDSNAKAGAKEDDGGEAEAKEDADAGADVTAKGDTDADAAAKKDEDAGAKAAAEADADAKAKADTGAKAGANADADAKAAAKNDAGAKTAAQTDADAKAKADVDAKAAAKVDADAKAAAKDDAGAKTAGQTDADAKAKADADAKAAATADTGAKAAAQSNDARAGSSPTTQQK